MLPGTEKNTPGVAWELCTSDVGNSWSTTAEPTSRQILAKPTIIKHPETPELVNTINGADHPDGPGSPASIATHDPGFDEKQAPSSLPADEDEVMEEWEGNNTLLPQECLEISWEKSEYKRSRAYNIIYNKKLAADLKDSAKDLFKQSWVTGHKWELSVTH